MTEIVKCISTRFPCFMCCLCMCVWMTNLTRYLKYVVSCPKLRTIVLWISVNCQFLTCCHHVARGWLSRWQKTVFWRGSSWMKNILIYSRNSIWYKWDVKLEFIFIHKYTQTIRNLCLNNLNNIRKWIWKWDRNLFKQSLLWISQKLLWIRFIHIFNISI